MDDRGSNMWTSECYITINSTPNSDVPSAWYVSQTPHVISMTNDNINHNAQTFDWLFTSE